MNNWIVKESAALSLLEMQNNAKIIRTILMTDGGWSLNAVCGALGNIEAESTINPGRWENDIVNNYSAGFGLTQWTPATKLRNWISARFGNDDFTNGDYQVARIMEELTPPGLDQYYPTSAYPDTMEEFKYSDKTPEYLAKAFLFNYERPIDTSQAVQNYRATRARYWYDYLLTTPQLQLPIWLLFEFSKGGFL